MEALGILLLMILLVLAVEQMKSVSLRKIRSDYLSPKHWRIFGWPFGLPLFAPYLEGMHMDIPVRIRIRMGEKFRRYYRYLIFCVPSRNPVSFKLYSRSLDPARTLFKFMGACKETDMSEFSSKNIYPSEIEDEPGFRQLIQDKWFKSLLSFSENDSNFLFIDSRNRQLFYCQLFRSEDDIWGVTSLTPLLDALTSANTAS